MVEEEHVSIEDKKSPDAGQVPAHEQEREKDNRAEAFEFLKKSSRGRKRRR